MKRENMPGAIVPLGISSELVIKVAIYPRFSLQTLLNYAHDSQPPPNIPRIFYRLRQGVGFRL